MLKESGIHRGRKARLVSSEITLLFDRKKHLIAGFMF